MCIYVHFNNKRFLFARKKGVLSEDYYLKATNIPQVGMVVAITILQHHSSASNKWVIANGFCVFASFLIVFAKTKGSLKDFKTEK